MPALGRVNNFITLLLAHAGDFQAPMLFVLLIGMLIVPMPPAFLDLFLVGNIALTFLILLRTTAITQALEFSVFPSLLLVTTLLRLALNISATRLILSSASEYGAGAVIHAFGTFVVGANPVVGIIIFVILVVIQFVVITAGAGRVAEVAARFTLDAMPGKQMAIDADVNAGVIDDQEAKSRRATIAREADFYGAMDGASKFVRGDAIAAIIMILINVIGGLIIGHFYHGLELIDSLQQYTMKTVGEGIVTQIPALIMSIATGLIVTRAASEADLGRDLINQVLGNYKTLAMAAGIIAAFLFVAGLPKLPFLLGASLLGGLAYYQWRNESSIPVGGEGTADTVAKAPTTADEMLDLLQVDPLEVEIGYGMVHLADPGQGGDLLERITTLRKQIAMDLGFVVPPVRVRDNIRLKTNEYSIKLWGVSVATGEILAHHLLVINPVEGLPDLPGAIPTTEPAFGLPACWINESQKLDAEMAGCTVVDPATVFITHLSEVIKSQASEIFSRQDLQRMLDKAHSASPALVDDLVPKALSLSEVHRVLQCLLRERVTIRNMNRILATLADHAATTRDIDQLTEYVRQSLARSISQQHSGEDGVIEVFTLEPQIEEMMLDHLRQTQFGMQVVLDPDIAQRLLKGVKAEAEHAISLGNQPVALCSSQIRPYFRRLIEKYMPGLTVLSHAEIVPGTPIKALGTVTLA
ncbi:MAG: flagellar biosynthesis protein FlhA [Armatimonadota bacterium]